MRLVAAELGERRVEAALGNTPVAYLDLILLMGTLEDLDRDAEEVFELFPAAGFAVHSDEGTTTASIYVAMEY